jgi:origin recognition complex subunit 5
VAVSAIPALLSRAAPLLRDVLARLLPRLVSANAWVASAVSWAESMSSEAMATTAAIEAEDALSQKTPSKRSRRAPLAARLAQGPLDSAVQQLAPSVPLLGAYLLLASFLASFNPARLDARYFLRDEHVLLPAAERVDASARKRKRGGAYRKKPAKRPPKDDGQREDLNRQQLLGPKPFPAERLLAILQALLIEAGGDASALVLGAAFAARRQDALSPEEETEQWERKSRGAGVMSLVSAASAMAATCIFFHADVPPTADQPASLAAPPGAHGPAHGAAGAESAAALQHHVRRCTQSGPTRLVWPRRVAVGLERWGRWLRQCKH